MDYLYAGGGNDPKKNYLTSKHFPNNFTSLNMRPDYSVSSAKPLISESFLKSPSELSSGKWLSSPTNMRSEKELRTAGMKVFLWVLLKSWRSRRQEIMQLEAKLKAAVGWLLLNKK